MRKSLIQLATASSLIAASLVVLMGQPLERISGPTTRRPSAPVLERIDIGGIDAAALPGAQSIAPAAQASALRAAGVSAAHLDQSPELLTAAIDSKRFDAVGVTWDRAGAPADAAVWVRTKEAGGWTDWELLGPSDLGPDGGTGEAQNAQGRVATEPLLTDGAQGVQVRVDSTRAPLNVRAELIESGSPATGPDGLSPQPTKGAAIGAVEMPATVPIAAAGGRAAPAATQTLPSGTPPRPYVISRAQWGADESLRGGPPTYTGATKVAVVHHTATTNSYSRDTAGAEIRAIYGYHTLTLGYNDIAYNALVDKFGQIYEGRYGGLENQVLSAATAAFNSSTFSVSALGSYDEVDAPAGMVESIAQLLAWKLAISYVDPHGTSQLRSAGYDGSPYPAGTIATFANVIGHRDAFPTACPGEFLYADLDAIRARIAQLTPAGLVQPVIATTPRTPTANGSARITSGSLFGGQWAVQILRPDGSRVVAYIGSGASIDVTWPMTDGGSPAADGTYTAIVSSNQNGKAALDYAGRISTAGAFGNLESLTVSPGGVSASGWAAVSDGATATVALSVDGSLAIRVDATGNRPDVADAYPSLGPSRGFGANVPMAGGVHEVCATGERAGLQSRLIGCLTIANPPNEPVGNIDAAYSAYAGVRFVGWALDRNTTASIAARFYVDGRYAGDAGATRSRLDVAAAYPAYGPDHGLDVTINTGVGYHYVCVNGVNVGAGASEALIRCYVVGAATGPPIGSLDTVTGANPYVLQGWSFDPDTTDAINVHAYVDGTYQGAFTANTQRPDLAQPFPFMGTAHGYSIALPAVAPGPHTLCVYAINVGAPGPNPLLGCRSIG
ncbi:MAG: N-acetylmuramoyl-L-alanine amidase [Acidimicrobiales bacterium]